MNNVKVVMDSHARGKVFVDGKELNGVVNVEISLGVDKTNQVTVTVLADTVDFDGIAEVTTIASHVKAYERGGKHVLPVRVGA